MHEQALGYAIHQTNSIPFPVRNNPFLLLSISRCGMSNKPMHILLCRLGCRHIGMRWSMGKSCTTSSSPCQVQTQARSPGLLPGSLLPERGRKQEGCPPIRGRLSWHGRSRKSLTGRRSVDQGESCKLLEFEQIASGSAAHKHRTAVPLSYEPRICIGITVLNRPLLKKEKQSLRVPASRNRYLIDI